eukprot:SAG11_NODE_3374_length_2490_cov_1.438310_1_plen_73_part_10
MFGGVAAAASGSVVWFGTERRLRSPLSSQRRRSATQASGWGSTLQELGGLREELRLTKEKLADALQSSRQVTV